MKSKRSVVRALAASIALAVPLVGAVKPASASVSCDWSWIVINGNPGAEDPSWAQGHSHSTGNHYIATFYWDGGLGQWVWTYYADNNGGNDGDTWDTVFGAIGCSTTP